MPIRVIYLDDEPGLCRMFEDNFAADDVLIETFTDPELAIEAINKSKPDLVFLDYRLPCGTGDSVACRIDPTICKVLITGDLSVNQMNSFMKVVHKPFDFVEMEIFIRGFSDSKRG